MSDPITKLDAGQVLQLVLDEDNRRLRTDTEINVDNLELTVDLDPETSGVHVGDKDTGDTLKVNPDGSINVSPKKNPEIVNVVLALSNTEYYYTFPTGTKKYIIKARNGTVKLSFVVGGTSTAYLTLPRGTVYQEDNLDFSGDIFVSSDKSNDTIEILSWT